MNKARTMLLVADDDTALRSLMRDNLAMEGFDVEEASDGAQCVDKAKSRHPSVIILDVDMPSMNGWDACRKIKSSPETKDIHVVMLSVHGEKENREKAVA